MANDTDKKKKKKKKSQMEAKSTQQRQRHSRPIKLPPPDEETVDQNKQDEEAMLKNWVCKSPGCGARFVRRTCLTRHRRTVHSGHTVPCGHCDRRFKSASYAEAHAKTCRLSPNLATDAAASAPDAVGGSAYPCYKCGHSYGNNLSFRAHLSFCPGDQCPQQQQQHVCHLCGATYSRLHDLTRHVQVTHNGEKRHVCQACFKPFGRASHLRRHMAALHKEGRICNIRKSAISRNDDTEREAEAEEPDSGDSSEPLLCPFSGCGQELPDVAQLRSHLAEHCGGHGANVAGGEGEGAEESSSSSSGDVAVEAAPSVAETPLPSSSSQATQSPPPSPSRKPRRRRGRPAASPDPFMCPLDRICCSSFIRYQHLVRHLSTTHKHLFVGGRDLLRRCTSLRLESPAAGGDGRMNPRAQLRRSVMMQSAPVDVVVALDGNTGNE